MKDNRKIWHWLILAILSLVWWCLYHQQTWLSEKEDKQLI